VVLRLYRHHTIHTGVPGAAPASAILADGEQIVAIGEARDVADRAVGSVEVIHLEGDAVIPGLYDAHIHTAGFARDLDSVDLRGTATLHEALSRVAAHAATVPVGGWVLGGRWDSNRWAPPAQPDRYALDTVCPDRPVLLPSIDGHTIWVNSAALRRAGIDADSPDPIGGQVGRDADGEPTGILRESASEPVRRAMQREHRDDLRGLLLRGQQQLLACGLTSVHDIDGEDARAAYRVMRDAGELRIRVHKAISVSHLESAIAEGRRTGDGDDWLSTGGVKIFSDGALGSHTCHMTTAFAGDPGNTGIAVTPFDDLVALSRAAITAGITVATHAIGDRANELVLDAYQQLAGRLPAGLRLRIEHAQFLRPQDVGRMARLGVVASMQPTHCTTDHDLVDRLLAGHQVLAYAWRSLLDAGVPLAFGSDAPVEDPDPFQGLHAAITRLTSAGVPPGGWQPEQRLTPSEALAGFTHGPAFAACQENRKGSLTRGRLADFVAVDTDPLTADPEQIRTTRVLATVVGGEIRWQRGR